MDIKYKKNIFLCLFVSILFSGCNYGPIDSNNNLDLENINKSEIEHIHDHSVEIEGSAMKTLTIQEIANLWEINSKELLSAIIQEFELKGNYTTQTILEDMRDEYKFSPAIIKDLAEKLKNK